MKSTAQDILFGAAGAVGAAYGMKFIPLQNRNLKAAVPILLGLFLSGQKNAMVARAGLGIGIAGALAAVKSFMPNVPMLEGSALGEDPLLEYTGEDEDVAGEDEDVAGDALGAIADFSGENDGMAPELMGAIADFSGDNEDI